MRISDWSSDVCSSDLAHGAVDLAAERHRGQLLALALQAGDDVGDFLADGGGRGGLAVGAREHRQCGVLVRHRAQRLDQRVELRQQHVLPRLRSEEHTSELQSLMRISYAVFCLKKKK